MTKSLAKPLTEVVQSKREEGTIGELLEESSGAEPCVYPRERGRSEAPRSRGLDSIASSKGRCRTRCSSRVSQDELTCQTLQKLTKVLQNGFPCGMIKIRVSPQTEQHTNNYTKGKFLYDEAREVPKGAKEKPLTIQNLRFVRGRPVNWRYVTQKRANTETFLQELCTKLLTTQPLLW